MSALSIALEFTNYLNTASVAVQYPNSGTGVMSYKSAWEKGDGYYGNSDGLHTVMYTCTPDFIGTVTMQATLATVPVETDWFNVIGTTSTYKSTDNRSTSTVNIYNFTGNFVWVRGMVSINNGQMQSVLYNH
jgi:hypothetical protein